MDLPTSDQYARMSVEEFDTTTLLAHAAHQAVERKYHEFPIIDIDGHHYETESMKDIIEFMEDPVLRQLGQVSAMGGGGGTMFGSGVGYQSIGGRVMRYPLRKIEKTPDDGVHRDIHLSLKYMVAMGIDYAVMFPTPMLTLGMHPQPEVEVGLARAYDRWMVEQVLPGNSRIKSLLYLP